MLVCPDAKKPGVTRIYLDVKETRPTLESEVGKFRTSCEELDDEDDYDEDGYYYKKDKTSIDYEVEEDERDNDFQFPIW